VSTGAPTDVTKFVATEVNTASLAPALIAGSELGPLAGLPLGSVLMAAVTGMHAATPTQVLRINIMPPLFVSFVIRLLEMDAKATNCPVVLVEGPTVVNFGGVSASQLSIPPQIPAFACEPLGARSNSTGSPSKSVGVTGKVSMFDVPPPGVEVTTVIWSTPATRRSEPVRGVVSEVLLTKVVGRNTPFTDICET